MESDPSLSYGPGQLIPGERNASIPDSAPTFKTDIPDQYTLPAGYVLKIRCPASGNPTPNITWLKNGEEPKRSQGAGYSLNKWTLKLENSMIQDSGNYTCVVCNYLGCIDHTVKIDVRG